MRKILLFLTLSLSLFAGQSVTSVAGAEINNSIAIPAATGDCRIEFIVDTYTATPQFGIAETGPCYRLHVRWEGSPLRISFYPLSGTCGGCDPLLLNLNDLVSEYAVIRLQVFSSTKNVTGEVWEVTGSSIPKHTVQRVYTTLGSPTTLMQYFTHYGNTQFFRMYSDSVALGSKRPTTAQSQTNCVVQWKFEGNLNDSCNSYFGSLVSGSITYNTSINQGPKAALKNCLTDAPVNNPPSWTTWISWRSGHTDCLDGTNSYSQADASDVVSHLWSQTGGTTVTLNSTTAAIPLTAGVVLDGDYTYADTVTDVTAATDSSSINFGAISFDNNGILTPSDPNVTKIFGPGIAFGQNPWGYEDERHKRAVELQNTYFIESGFSNPTWNTFGQGTITYPFSGKGVGGQSCTTLSAGINATTLSIPVTNANCLSLSSLPTAILIGNAWGNQEMIRICAAPGGTTGAQTLTACYNGRGVSSYGNVTQGVIAAQPWNSGDTVGEYRIQGTGTLFSTDPSKPLAPAGLPGPVGAVVYFTGTVSKTGTLNILLGNSTVWNTSNNVLPPYSIRVEATHGGVPFVWWSTISAVTDTTHITTDRSLPSDTDAGNFAYKIVSLRYPSPQYISPLGAIQTGIQNIMYCETETACFATPRIDNPSLSLTTQPTSGTISYTYIDQIGIQSAFGPNFYGSGLAMRAFYHRSGWAFAKTTADYMDENWVKSPEVSAGTFGGLALLQGGGVIGAIADKVLNATTALSWDDVRQFGINGTGGTLGCNDYDTRDTGIMEGWVALLALFDPNSTYHTQWLTALSNVSPRGLYQRDIACKGSDNSYANGAYFNNAGASRPAVDITLGSAIVVAHTGNTFFPSGDSQTCFGTASGTGHITNGQAALVADTGVFASGDGIAVTLISTGQTIFTQFALTDASHITLAGLWPYATGTSGQIAWMVTSNRLWSVIAATVDDTTHLAENFVCTYVDTTHIVLNKAWPLATSVDGSLHIYGSNLAGFGQQPFMLGGYKMSALTWASQVDDPTIAANYTALLSGPATWLHDTGYEPLVGIEYGGYSYGRIFQACEPVLSGSSILTTWRNSGCQTGRIVADIRASRVLTAEMTNGIRAYVQNAGYSSPSILYGDQTYGAVYGYCAYTNPDPAYYCDANYVIDELSDASLGAYKWPGFFFGMGQSHQWPAVRISGAIGIFINKRFPSIIRVGSSSPRQ